MDQLKAGTPEQGLMRIDQMQLAAEKKFKITGNPDRTESDMSNQKPFDMPAMHIFKIWGGQIHEIEAIGIVVPYNSPTGWE